MNALVARKNFRMFFSLKWKALILSSLVLIAIAATLSALSYISLSHQYESQRNEVGQQHIIQLEGLIERSGLSLQQFAGLIPSLSGMPESLRSGDEESLEQAFEIHWPNLQIDAGVELARFYSKTNQLMGSWGEEGLQNPLSSSVLGRVWDVNEREYPVSFLDCIASCIQYAVVPILMDGKSVGSLLLGRSLVDVILGFKQLSATDISIISSGINDESAGNQRWIPNWQANIVAATAADKTLLIIQASAKQEPSLMRAAEGMNLSVDGFDYEVRLIPLKKYVDNGEANLIVVSDITKDLQGIRLDTRKSMITSLIGLIVAEALMLALLWGPMSRLTRIASSLPLLSKREYQAVRSSVSVPRKWHYADDEIDVLNKTAVTLSTQLESLEQESKEHTLALAQRADEVMTQKDFVTSLLDTAQAIILTQNSGGEIIMINQFGESLTGYSEAEIKGKHFTDLVSPDDLSTRLQDDLNDLIVGRLKQLNHEFSMVCSDQRTRQIAWYHSRPPRHHNQDMEVLSVGIDITDRKIAEERLSWLAEHDPLTGIYNRRRFQQELGKAIAASKRYGHSGSLIFLDIDQFKDINDSSGHQVGDHLLKEVASRLKKILRVNDSVGRFGGDEFALVLPKTDRDGAIEVAKKIEENIKRIELSDNGRFHRISASIGIVHFPSDGDNKDDLLANADISMYQAKENGRGCWHEFSSGGQVRERLHQRIYWKEQIEHAFVEDRFILYYQPIVNIKSSEVTHYEALLRLVNTDGSIVMPAKIIEVAESTGLIHRIDRAVVTIAINQLQRLHTHGYDANLSINLSGHAFGNPELFDYIAKMISDIDFNPERLIFEVTETAAIADFSAANECIRAIKKLGCRFALDDFGVGFSSFYSLKQLPVDYVKIDGSFVKELDKNHDDKLLVQAISQVAQGFGKKTIAEFVENEEILNILESYGVDYAQGYHLGKPAPINEVFPGLGQKIDKKRGKKVGI